MLLLALLTLLATNGLGAAIPRMRGTPLWQRSRGPNPDQAVPLNAHQNPLNLHSRQIIALPQLSNPSNPGSRNVVTSEPKPQVTPAAPDGDSENKPSPQSSAVPESEPNTTESPELSRPQIFRILPNSNRRRRPQPLNQPRIPITPQAIRVRPSIRPRPLLPQVEKENKEREKIGNELEARNVREDSLRSDGAAEPRATEGAELGTEEGADPGTEGGASLGTEEGAEPGTEGGTSPGTEGGAIPGTEGGASPGTEEGDIPGTEEGAIPGTEEGASPGTEGGVSPGIGGIIPRTEGEASPGTEGEVSPGTEGGVIPGTEEGTEPGTEVGAEPGTEVGAEPGTEVGAEPGTEVGPEPGTEEGAPIRNEMGNVLVAAESTNVESYQPGVVVVDNSRNEASPFRFRNGVPPLEPADFVLRQRIGVEAEDQSNTVEAQLRNEVAGGLETAQATEEAAVVRQVLSSTPHDAVLVSASWGSYSILDDLIANATEIRPDIVDTFSCVNRSYGYYADVDNDCQLFHVCVNYHQLFPTHFTPGKVIRFSFICPKHTIFSQDSMVCAHAVEALPCSHAPYLYGINDNFFRKIKDDEGRDVYAQVNYGFT